MNIFSDNFLSNLLDELLKRVDKLVEWRLKDSERQYLTVNEAAKYCGVSRNTFEQVFLRAGLKPILIPGYSRKLFSKKSIDDFMMDHEF